MKLYEIDEAIRNCIDEETGEITDYKSFENLQMERKAKIEGVAKYILNLKADLKAFKDREKHYKNKAKSCSNLIEKLSAWLSMATNGEQFKTVDVNVYFTPSEKTICENENEFVDWCFDNGRTEFLRTSASADLTAIAEALEKGEELPYCFIDKRSNVQVR